MTDEQIIQPAIQWETGTAYDLFVSLFIFHTPEKHGVRASWAAGVRSRIPAPERKFLEDVYPLLGAPLKWIRDLPEPRDAITALWALKQIPSAERMIKMQQLDSDHVHDDPVVHQNYLTVRNTLLGVMEKRAWSKGDSDVMYGFIGKKEKHISREDIEHALDWWSRPDELGDISFSALQAYYQSFFEEEEARIKPFLDESLKNAQALSKKVNFTELFKTLSQGIEPAGDEFAAKRYIFTPSFWTTPLIYFERVDRDTLLVLYGARPANVSMIPGETLPDGLVRSLKAMADPTRLKILFYISQEGLSPSEIARRLHLRAPTVTHHLNELRLASLVNMTITGQERKYTARHEAIQAAFENLQEFLKPAEK